MINASLIVRRANNPCRQCLRELKQMERTMTHLLQHRHSEDPNTNTEATPISWNVVEDTEPQPGTHLVTPRHGYHHHGIYVGEGRVMHYGGLWGALSRGRERGR